jgi:hypothetical protein
MFMDGDYNPLIKTMFLKIYMNGEYSSLYKTNMTHDTSYGEAPFTPMLMR